MNSRSRWSIQGGFGLLTACLISCAAPQEKVELSVASVAVLDKDIDADPFRLLPSGAVGWGRVDVKSLTVAEYGAAIFAWAAEFFPPDEHQSFLPERDIDSMALGVYGTIGFDGVGVLTGRFDVAAIDAHLTTQAGRPEAKLRKGRYSGRTLFSGQRMSVAILTPKTAVVGSEKGVRRVLERIEEGRLERHLPPWMEQLLASKNASIALGMDLDAQVIPSVLRTRLAFLEGLRAARVVGNYEAPGLNLAGTLTYDKPDTATKAASDILARAEQIRRADVLLMLLRMPRPFRKVDASAAGREAQVAVEVEGGAITVALSHRDALKEALEKGE